MNTLRIAAIDDTARTEPQIAARAMRSFASATAHAALAELLRSQTAPPDGPISVAACSPDEGIQVVVHIDRYTPWVPDDRIRLDAFLSRVAHEATERAAVEQRVESPRDGKDVILARITPLMREIYSMLRFDRPTKLSVLATRLGRKPGGSLRTLCSMLCILGLAKHVKNEGYKLA